MQMVLLAIFQNLFGFVDILVFWHTDPLDEATHPSTHDPSWPPCQPPSLLHGMFISSSARNRSKNNQNKTGKGLRDGVDSRDDQDRPESIITMIAALLAAAQAGVLETETQGTGEASLFFVITTTSSSSSGEPAPLSSS